MEGSREQNEELTITQRLTGKKLMELLDCGPYLCFFCEVSIASFIFFQVVYIRMEWEFHSGYTLIPFAGLSTLMLGSECWKYIKSAEVDPKYEAGHSIINWLCILMFLVLLLAHFFVNTLSISIINCAFAFWFICKIAYSKFLCQELLNLSNFMVNALRTDFMLICLMISFKYDGIIEWSWEAVMWPYWVMFGFMAFVSLGLTIIVFSSGYKFTKGEISSLEFFFALWLFYTIVGLTFSSFAFVINEIRFLKGDSVALSQALTIPLFYLPVFCIFTFFLYRKMLMARNEQERELNESSRSMAVRGQSERSTRLVVPSFIQKFSSTYFQRISREGQREGLDESVGNITTNMRLTVLGQLNETIDEHEQKEEIPADSPEGPSSDIISTQKVQFDIHLTPEIKDSLFNVFQDRSQPNDTEKVPIQDMCRPPTEIMKQAKVNEEPTCALCFNSDPNGVLMECGHGGICFRCGARLLRSKGNCPLCRQSVLLVLKIDTLHQFGSFVRVIDYVFPRTSNIQILSLS